MNETINSAEMNEAFDKIIDVDALKEAVQTTIVQNSLMETVGPTDKTEDVIVSRIIETLLYRADNQISWCSETGFKVYQETEELTQSPYAQFDTVVAKIEAKQQYQQQLEIQELFFSRLMDKLQMAYLDLTGGLWKPRRKMAPVDAKVEDTTAGMEMARYKEKWAEKLERVQAQKLVDNGDADTIEQAIKLFKEAKEEAAKLAGSQ